ncbi:host-nuclease inhibitor Gam family protein [uncultured Acidaminococcus sp.]|jgi:hypothetical protein|uniref:host-nuclease inhibitor Gam family protein n=1 Tax=uncultured Acidaminococcus sp. TaxID=352152 RepID=UPI0020667D94|nr:host-nuclease inhibitor Gam family protein [uncultured Acidaminococcus sp.]DAR42755.1 MAG TPA: hypothetical protein [Caudoviricetes sp.]
MKREINVMDYEKDFLEETAPTYVNKEVWKPKTAKEADWCLGKIREKEAEIEDVLRFVEAKKKSLDEYLEKRTRPLMDAQEHLSALLQMYAETQLEGKKKRSISLPNGKFGFRKSPAKFQRDEATLLEYAEKELPDCVKIKKSVDWANLKKGCTVDGDHLISQDGEIIPGVTVEQQPDKFYTEVG